MNDQTMMAPPGVADMVPQFGSRGRIVRLGCLAICAALLPGLLLGQTSQWSNGSGGTIYYNGGNVGIGTTSPGSLLTLSSSTSQDSGDGFTNLRLSYSGTAFNPGSTGATLTFAQQWWSGSPSYLVRTGAIRGWKGGGDGYFGGGLQFLYQAISGNPMSVGMVLDAGGNVGIGTTNPQHLLHVAGAIGAEEVIVSSTGADYVFRPGYRLRPLSELDAFIKENHHLPDIPSETDVKEKGLSLGEMQTKVLAKVEELTLLMIDADEHIRQADERNKSLELQNTELQKRIARLEAASIGEKE
jgi:hypothetical protein